MQKHQNTLVCREEKSIFRNEERGMGTKKGKPIDCFRVLTLTFSVELGSYRDNNKKKTYRLLHKNSYFI